MNDDSSKVATAFLVGGVIGAFIALLYAPKSGARTRRDIARTAGRIKDNIANIADDTIHTVNAMVSDVKDRAEDLIELGAGISDNAKKEVIKAIENGQKVLEKQKKRIVEGLGL